MMRLQETRFGKPDISPTKTSQHTSDDASVLIAAAHEHEHRSPGKPGADVTLASAGIPRRQRHRQRALLRRSQ